MIISSAIFVQHIMNISNNCILFNFYIVISEYFNISKAPPTLRYDMSLFKFFIACMSIILINRQPPNRHCSSPFPTSETFFGCVRCP